MPINTGFIEKYIFRKKLGEREKKAVLISLRRK